MTKTLILFITCTFAFIIAQEKALDADKLFRQYTALKNHEFSETAGTPEDHKCAFGLVNSVRYNYDIFSEEQKQSLKILLQRIPRTHSIVSPSGKFRVHYNASGVEAPDYEPGLTSDENALLVAEALDSSWNFEVNYLGYPPPRDNGGGGDSLYDVYITNTGGGGSGFYGYTEFETEVTPGSDTYTSFMVIDDDYSGFYSSGIEGAMVTVAHELHHGIQMGNYIYRESDLFYYELSSTAMEEFVYDSINDYYAYMSSYFQSPNLALNQQNGYNIAILNIFLEMRFDHELLRRIWQLMPEERALTAINRALTETGSSFDVEYHTFGVWTYYTKNRSIEGRFFQEAAFYPLIRPMITMSFTPPESMVQGASKPTGNNFIYFLNAGDTLAVLISNTNINSANINPLSDHPYSYRLFDYEYAGSTKLTEDYYALFAAADPDLWELTEIFNSVIVRSGQVIVDVTATDNYSRYPGNTGKFTISRTGDDSNPLIVNFNLGGSAIPGIHYSEIPSSIEIPSGKSIVTLEIIPLGSAETEDRTVVLQLTEDTSYVIGTKNEATVQMDFGDSSSSEIVYPAPFRYSINTELNIPVLNSIPGNSVEFHVFSLSMDEIYSQTFYIQKLREITNGIKWNVLKDNNERLASGIYIYVVKYGDDVKKGKFLIFND